MNINEKQSHALFRYSVIIPLVNGTKDPEDTIASFCRKVAAAELTLPDVSKRKYSASTIERWYRSYKQLGFDGLLNTDRSDEGKSRSIAPEVEEEIRFLKKSYPKMPSTVIFRKLMDDGAIGHGQVSLSSVTRCVNRIAEEAQNNSLNGMRRYEHPHVNDAWYGDTCFSFSIRLQDGTKQKTFIIGLMDDASRLVLGAHVFGSDDYNGVMQVMRSAVAKYGVPKMFVFDNGKNYRSKQMDLLVARIGSSVHFCHPYSPQQKAKLERFWGTMKMQFLSSLNPKEFDSLESLDKRLQEYISTYNNAPHSALGGKSPQERFFSDPECIKRLPQEQIDRSFLFEIERKCSIDGVVSINKVEYEIDSRFAGKKIRLRYNPGMSEIYVVEADETLTPVHILNKVENSKVKREKVRFGGEEP